MGERLLCKQEVIGSIPFTSTTDSAKRWRWCAAVAAAVISEGCHGSERAETGGAPTTIVEDPVCWRLRPSALFFDRVKRV